mmetsp:Transcript_16227/g.24060  ORF Transcript_16227/g.24060 Transcript_16227/m.24060 type:complete len:92 (-) Transcript_16227:594-869(-)
MPLAHTPAKGMNHMPQTATLEQKAFSAPKDLFFSAAIDYVANRLRREQQDCSTLTSSSGTVLGLMGMDDGDDMAMVSSFITRKVGERWKMK